MKLLREIKGVFVPPKRKYYIGKIAHGTPYFNPWNFVSTAISARRLKLKTPEQIAKYKEQYPYVVKLSNNYMFSNMPMVHRAKEWTFKVFDSWYWLQIGLPIYIYWHGLGWKDKYSSPRFEWAPAFYIFFFKWQFCIHWLAPDGDNDKYYEMILWWKNYSKCDIVKAKNSWCWTDIKTKKSTWNDKYLSKYYK